MSNPGIRSLIGTFAFLTYVIVYILIAMAIGARYLAEANGLAQFAFYAIAGLAWLPGAMAIIKWMAKSRKSFKD